MTPITMLLFDVGGALSMGTATQVKRRLAQRLGCEATALDDVWTAQRRPLTTGAETPESFAGQIADSTGGSADAILQAWEAAASETFVPRSELIAFARRLLARYRVGILSNTNALHARVNRTAGVYEGFDPVLLSCEMGCAKPDPAIFRRTLAELGLPPSACVLIDDRPENVAAARAAGMQGVVFTTTPDLESRLRALGVGVV